MRSPTTLLLTALSGLLAAPANAQFDDAMWFAARQGRTLTKVSHHGEVLKTVDLSSNGLDLSRVCRAPNGELWIINFITPTLTIVDRDGGNLRNINLSAFGSPTDIVFDKGGTAWATFNGAGIVGRFAPNGVLLNTIPAPGAPLGITIDNQGAVWVGHRVAAPSRVTKIDPTTFATTIYYFPAGTRSLGGLVLADSPGIAGTSRIWSAGDSGNEVVTFDDQGTVLNTTILGTVNTAGVSSLTLDGKGNIWALHFRSAASSGQVYGIDRNTYTVVQSISDSPEPIAVFTDSFGRPWFQNRVSFSGPQPSEIRRIDRTGTNLYEVNAQVGIGSYNPSDPNGFHRALVIDPLGDFDGDGVPNIVEVQSGTSPYDSQSTPSASILTTGYTGIGGTCQIELKGTLPLFAAIAFSDTGIPGIVVNPFLGKLRLDPLTLYPVTISTTLQTTVPLTIPNSAALQGRSLRMQGVWSYAAVSFTNDTGLAIF